MKAGGLDPYCADDNYEQVCYDLVVWNTSRLEWESMGYEYLFFDSAVARLLAKRRNQPDRNWRIVQVNMDITHTDVTKLADKLVESKMGES